MSGLEGAQYRHCLTSTCRCVPGPTEARQGRAGQPNQDSMAMTNAAPARGQAHQARRRKPKVNNVETPTWEQAMKTKTSQANTRKKEE